MTTSTIALYRRPSDETSVGFAKRLHDAATVLAMGGRYVFVRPDSAQLAELAGLVAEGSLRVEVAQTFDLADAAAAHRKSEEGHVRGKLVLTIS